MNNQQKLAVNFGEMTDAEYDKKINMRLRNRRKKAAIATFSAVVVAILYGLLVWLCCIASGYLWE